MASKFTSCPDLLSTPSKPIKYLINQLIPRATMVLMHGDPRTKKSYTALELAVSCANGSAAFGFDRFESAKNRVLYLSQEDPEHVIRNRLHQIMLDKEIDPPENLFVGIHAGINLDDPHSRRELYAQVKGEHYDLVFIDPIRRFTMNADKGPSEVTPITTYLRRFCVELDTTVGILHHNVKPFVVNGNGVARKEAYNASGGDWFASCECPISFRSNGDHWTHVIPTEYKLSYSPEPFDVQVTSDSSTGRIHIIARDITQERQTDEILEFVVLNPDSSENTIAKSCSIKRSSLSNLLKQLESQGLLIHSDGPNRSRLWRSA